MTPYPAPLPQVLIFSLGLWLPYCCPCFRAGAVPHIISRFNSPTTGIQFVWQFSAQILPRAPCFLFLHNKITLPSPNLLFTPAFVPCCHHCAGNTRLLTNPGTSTTKVKIIRRKNCRYSTITMRPIWIIFGSFHYCLNLINWLDFINLIMAWLLSQLMVSFSPSQSTSTVMKVNRSTMGAQRKS